MRYFRTSSELSFLNKNSFKNLDFQALDYWEGDFRTSDDNKANTRNENLDFLYDCYYKILCRGQLTFPSLRLESAVIDAYGTDRISRDTSDKNISYELSDDLKQSYGGFSSFATKWSGLVADVAVDPEHPENERKLLTQILNRFGNTIAYYIYPQAPIEHIIPLDKAEEFRSQRVDFLLIFPNGRGLVIEPGDHDTDGQKLLDDKRDAVFLERGIETLRPRNFQLDDDALYARIGEILDSIDATRFLSECEDNPRDQYLFLLPSLVSRIEYALMHFLLGKKMLSREKTRIRIVEQDLRSGELAVASFFDRLSRLIKLYGLSVTLPEIDLIVEKSGTLKSDADSTKLDSTVRNWVDELKPEGVVINTNVTDIEADLEIDVSIKSNSINAPRASKCKNSAVIRNSFRHNTECRFEYLSRPKPLADNSETELLLTSFLQDFFRKNTFRDGQLPIIARILSQKNTIGLLPTSGGKSICYQLAGILTPGSTLVIDPIIALMQDQEESLKTLYRVGRVFAWHSGLNLRDNDAGKVFQHNIFVFIAPERFLSKQFREAIRCLGATDVFINYAVSDEAHSVSMWGHDFRPAYLSLERHLREFCTYQGLSPVVVALTGTASQSVLIDLKIELGITELEAIVRPKTFDRPELIFSVFACPNNKKLETLSAEIFPWIEARGRLGVTNLLDNAWGLIFTHYANGPSGIFSILSHFVTNAAEVIRANISESRIADGNLKYGLYSGKQPNNLSATADEWTSYKKKILSAFKRGDTRLLVGNKAVGVGLDNERLNWVVNYRMPSSLEEYYQQCGRAGRSGQISACALIFSDDNPSQTRKWFQGEIPNKDIARPRRWDDIGIVSGFHDTNFPGKHQEIDGTLKVLKDIFRAQDNREATISRIDEQTEKYISYLLILGILTDYIKDGIDRFSITIASAVIDYLDTRTDEKMLNQEIIDSLHRYLSRYKPIRKKDIEEDISGSGNLSARVVKYLIEFLYENIERQRKTAIISMYEYCTADTDPNNLRSILISYFDKSKFSDRLDKMATEIPDYDKVRDILKEIEGHEDVERLYWETSRLLAENLYQAGLGSLNLYAKLYREYRKIGVSDDVLARLFGEMVDSIRLDQVMAGDPARNFIHGFMADIAKIDDSTEQYNIELICVLIGILYDKCALEYIPQDGDLKLDAKLEGYIKLYLANKQVAKLLKQTNYERTIGEN